MVIFKTPEQAAENYAIAISEATGGTITVDQVKEGEAFKNYKRAITNPRTPPDVVFQRWVAGISRSTGVPPSAVEDSIAARNFKRFLEKPGSGDMLVIDTKDPFFQNRVRVCIDSSDFDTLSGAISDIKRASEDARVVVPGTESEEFFFDSIDNAIVSTGKFPVGEFAGMESPREQLIKLRVAAERSDFDEPTKERLSRRLSNLESLIRVELVDSMLNCFGG